MMLSNRKSAKGTVKHLPCSCYTTLIHQELRVIKPNSWHLEYKEQIQYFVCQECPMTSTNLMQVQNAFLRWATPNNKLLVSISHSESFIFGRGEQQKI